MSYIKTYRDLDAWRGAMDLSASVDKLTQTFPDTERYGLISQLRRGSVSIPSNIAEGQARGTVAFGLYFLRVAIGSAAEVDTQLERVRQMLYGMRREHERRLATAGVKAGSALLLVVAATGLFG